MHEAVQMKKIIFGWLAECAMRSREHKRMGVTH
jgi:hypothetical protein